MNRVLKTVKQYLIDNIGKTFNIESISIGTVDEFNNGLIDFGEFPAILITPGEDRDFQSNIANHKGIEYDIIFFLIYNNSIPEETYIDIDKKNQFPTIFELSNHMHNIFGKDKNLNGTVYQWPGKWVAKQPLSANGLQSREIITSWKDPFIPWTSSVNDQNDLIIDPEERTSFDL